MDESEQLCFSSVAILKYPVTFLSFMKLIPNSY